MRIKIVLMIGILLGLFIDSPAGYAQNVIEFGPAQTRLYGSVPYTVLGLYKAQFNDFTGKIIINDKTDAIESVYIEIKVASIKSSCNWCDNAVRSRRLLGAAQYPLIVFKSDKISKSSKGYEVTGILDMHGVKKTMTFPFQAKVIKDKKTSIVVWDIHGSWVINRKEFKITWSKIADKGGVIVGNQVTVDWGIKANLPPASSSGP